MGLESVEYIDDLVTTNPTGSDGLSQGDNHIRNMKTGLKQTFPDADAPYVTSFITGGGTGDAQTVTTSATLAGYVTGMVIRWKPIADNTGACTINVNSLGAKSIKLMTGDDPVAGDIDADGICTAIYDGTNFVLQTYASANANAATVVANIADINTVAGIDTEVSTVSGIAANVTTVAGIDSDVTTVSGVSADVTTVATGIADVSTVATDIANVNTTATNITNVNTVAGISANVTTVAGISADVTAVAADATDIGTVSTNIADVNTVAGVSANVTTVAGISSDVTTVATNVTDITNFSDVYIGPSATEPTTRADTSALQAGDLFFNTTSGYMMVYTGAAWENAYVPSSGFLEDSDIGVTVQGYDADTAKYDDVTANFTGTLQNGGSNVVVDTDIGSTVQAYDADTAKLDTAQSWTAQQTFGELKETVYTLGTSGSIALDPANGSIQVSTLTGDPTFTDSLEAGQTVVLMLNGGASYTVTWPTVTWCGPGGNAAPTLTANDTVVFWKVSTTLYAAVVGSYT